MRRATIVLPCYNEALRIDKGVFLDFLKGNPSFGVLFVDDGSDDGSLRLLESISAESPDGRASVLALERNSGKAAAVRAGMLKALETPAQAIGFMDSDLATPLDEIPRLLEPIEAGRAAVSIGSRVSMLGYEIRRSMARHYMGRAFATCASFTLGVPVYDTQCGAKFFRACPDLGRLFEEPFHVNWTFDVELLARLKTAGSYCGRPFPGCVEEVPLRHWIHAEGSKVKPWDFFKSLAELRLIRAMMKADAKRRAGE